LARNGFLFMTSPSFEDQSFERRCGRNPANVAARLTV
jgi:hypothetical protein